MGHETIVRVQDGSDVTVSNEDDPDVGSDTEAAAETSDAEFTYGPGAPLAIAPFDTAKAKQHQAAWAKYLGVPVEITDPIGMKLVLIPPGGFVANRARVRGEQGHSL